MSKEDKPLQAIISSLSERAKELNCLYEVDEALSRADAPLAEVAQDLVDRLPPGWQFPDVCCARLRVDGAEYTSPGFEDSPWRMAAEVKVENELIGELEVFYTELRPNADDGPFLKEENRLIQAIADRIGLFVMQRQVRQVHDSWETAMRSVETSEKREWGVILDFLRRTDPYLLIRITRKMINHLCWAAVEGADALLEEFFSRGGSAALMVGMENRPIEKATLKDLTRLTERTYEIASSHLGESEVVQCIQMWIEEEKSGFLITTLENPHSSLADITEAVSRFRSAEAQELALSVAVRESMRVALLRRLFLDDLKFINFAKEHVEVRDFYELLDHLILPPNSHGHLGGKSAGLFVATQIVRRSEQLEEFAKRLRIPNTWHISSDGVLEFIRYNNLEDLYNRKYMEIERVRQEYPHIVQVFKNSKFPPELSRGLALALDDFESKPLIVRSSSLLEDQLGSAFSGKYKSLFLANQGSKKERLQALQDAVAEVYASIFSPDPIEYRAQRGLLDFHEEMGIMIQEVVGKRVGDYFLPSYAGVAFGNNEFRWSPRIQREDGVVRLVPGLGTRAVDRLSDDYPTLICPGQPGLRVNVSPDEIAWYSPNKLDVINMKTNTFETLDVKDFVKKVGVDYPGIRHVVSMVENDRIRKLTGLAPDLEANDVVVTFDGLVQDTDFVATMRTLLEVLRENIGAPPDIEFASDGAHFYLLQCRSQSYAEEYAPAPIPQDVPLERMVFSANRYISNGRVPEITHIVYVDPEAYGRLESLEELRAVGATVSRLNALLPKRQFILIGPGRWGSRGDIRLGVHATYSDINRTAVLLEVARKEGHYVPELSFGTHFFQDLVESDIRYIPLYPDEEGIVFNERFLRGSHNILAEVLPKFADLAETVRVIDVPRVTEGKILRVLMNADLDRAVGILSTPTHDTEPVAGGFEEAPAAAADHWRWRLRMAERIAADMDPEKFGVVAMYVFGSTKNATAGPGSDLDLLIHVTADAEKRSRLAVWLDGWSCSLAEMNYLRTGYRSEGLLDVHFVTDEDIANRTSYAVKIGAVTDAARPLPLEKPK
jgi:pyruvate,water dikinase